jgi:uncharacterized protein (TIGR03083 family)
MTPTTTPRSAAHDLAEEEDRRFRQLVRSLSPDEWGAATDCPGWDVRAVVLHVLGAAESYRVRELLHQLRAGRRAAGGRDLVDGVNDVQIADRQHLAAEEVVDRLEIAGPRFLRFRRRFPAPLRRLSVPAPGVGKVSFGHLMDTTYTRDSWMHRVDIHRATGRHLEVDDHDARLIADVVDDWARRHGRPYHLVLTGPAGGTFGAGSDGEAHELDAVEFCRILAGRAPGHGLLTTPVLF